MKKLLIATDTFSPRVDGVSRFLLNMIPELKKEFEVKVIAPDFRTETSTENVKRIPSFRFQIGDLVPAKFKIKDIYREVKNSDIVFVQSLAPIGATAIVCGSFLRKKVVAYMHVIEWEVVTNAISRKFLKNLIGSLIKIAVRCLYNRCSLLIAPSTGVISILNKNKVKAKKMVIHMGIDTSKFMPANNKAKAKINININPNKQVIGYVGRLAREKDLRTLYRAFSRVKKNYPDTVLLIVGDGLEEIKKLFRNKKGIIMAGKVRNVVPYLQAMDIYALPSLTETSSLSTMEAMSCGLAVVVTPVGYVQDYVVDGFNGYFFPKKDPYALSKELEKLLGNERLKHKIGMNARRTIENYFSWSTTVEKIKRVFRKL